MRLSQRAAATVISAWAAGWFIIMIVGGGSAWPFFVQGASALADAGNRVSGGLHLYAAAPVLQIGPLAFLAVLPLLAAGPAAALAGWQVLGAAAGLLVVYLVARLRPGRDDGRLAPAALCFLPVWMFLAVGVVHVDDVLALLLSVGALCAARAGRPVVTGLLLGLAADAKPWALGFAALLLLLPGARARLSAATVLAVVLAAAWAPFFAGDPGTSAALRYTIENRPVSALRAIGVHDPRTPPWDRPAQLALALALGAVAVWRGHWPAVPLLAVAARLVLEPGGNKYYVAGLVVGTLIWDVLGSRARLPWWTIAASLGLFAARWVPMPDAWHGRLIVAFFAAACTLPLLPGRGRLGGVPDAAPGRRLRSTP